MYVDDEASATMVYMSPIKKAQKINAVYMLPNPHHATTKETPYPTVKVRIPPSE
jgi:hypothetical protein